MTVYRNPWGRLVEGTTSTDVSLETLKVAFVETGLRPAAAEKAAQGFLVGTYLSFEHAAHAQTVWDRRQPALSEAKVREVARRFEGQTQLAVTPPSTLGSRQLEERRSLDQVQLRLVETASARAVGEGIIRARLISEGQGSSGFYPASTLQEAARSGVFAKGTHCYLDHPSQSEALDRPERSVRDLAGVLEAAATYRDGAIYADIRIFAPHRELITERASVIGMSIRGDGVVERRTMGAVSQPVIASLTRIDSVDFVTRPGRGGQILSVA